MLLQEEQFIIHWLTEYGALTKTQVIRMLKDKPPQTAEKIIRGLKRDVLLYDISGGYYLGVDPMCQPDQRMILAVWVLLQFIDKVEPMAHYPATYPSQIFFLKEDIGYEIVVLYDGEQHLARLLQPQEDLRYIFVLRAHLRHPCFGQRSGRQDPVGNPGPHSGIVHPRYLHPCDRRYAEAGQ